MKKRNEILILSMFYFLFFYISPDISFFHKKRTKKFYLKLLCSSQIAGDERIELPPKVLETPIIPFDQSPKKFIVPTKLHTCWLSNRILTMLPFDSGHLMTFLELVGQALTLLVAVSSMRYRTSTPALSTSSSSRGFTPFGWDISSWGGLHA